MPKGYLVSFGYIVAKKCSPFVKIIDIFFHYYFISMGFLATHMSVYHICALCPRNSKEIWSYRRLFLDGKIQHVMSRGVFIKMINTFIELRCNYTVLNCVIE